MTPLAGKVAVVTGASRGIGAAIARRLSAEGVRLGLASGSGDDLGLPDTVARPTDVRDREQVGRLVDETAERFGGLDILVANAGVGAYGPFAELPPEQLEEMIDTNVKGVLHAAASSVPHLLARGGGDIVSVASEAGRRGLPNEAVYCASKFAQVGFHACARPRAAAARHSLYERLPGRRRHRLRDGRRARSHAGDAGAGGNDER
jgi:meso-butanediol dehydrogenase / (S,S)-butanediol dehydrogenase / diacetyl reductase